MKMTTFRRIIASLLVGAGLLLAARSTDALVPDKYPPLFGLPGCIWTQLGCLSTQSGQVIAP